tara:strand:+ start:519 stop:2177 length:1659 start_codon:yes stop_codon:yes gene_type:complete
MISRIQIPKIQGADELFTEPYLNYLIHLHDKFSDQIQILRKERLNNLQKAHEHGLETLKLPISEINTQDWHVDTVPEDLKQPGIEISGPSSIASMMINALNPGPEGERAVGYLDDDEDSGGHSLQDTINSAINRLSAINKTLEVVDSNRNRHYKLQPGNLPFFMHRERGLHLDEHEIKIDGSPISATLLGTSLTIFYCGQAQFKNNLGVYFYLPKLESVNEAKLYKQIFDESKKFLNLSESNIIKAIILVESLPAVFQMENMLHALGKYGAGLNAARWDLKASILEFIMTNSNSVWPDRFDVDIKTTEFMSNIFRRLVAICLKHSAVAIGGMATALPSSDDEINKIAANSIQSDKEWEAQQGFIRGWSAHIYHMKTASDPFKNLAKTGWTPSNELKNPENFPIKIETPTGKITSEGTRRNIRTIIEYVEGWLNGRGAKGIDSLEGYPGKRPALMEDLATARISVGQVAQRIIHSVTSEDTGDIHTMEYILSLIESETEAILKIRKQESPNEFDSIQKNYIQSSKITSNWIKNYTELNFRSLGSYSKQQLLEM